jgi:transcriptional pleiotropic regulator of transition state genes
MTDNNNHNLWYRFRPKKHICSELSDLFTYSFRHAIIVKKKERRADMKATGNIRRLDALGRITLPKKLRDEYGLEHGTEIEMYVKGNLIILKKQIPKDIFTGDTKDLVRWNGIYASKENIIQLCHLAGLKINK